MLDLIDNAVKLIEGITGNTITSDEINSFTDAIITEYTCMSRISVLRFIYDLSFHFLDEKEFYAVFEHIKSIGIDSDFFTKHKNDESNMYWFERYYKCNKQEKKQTIKKLKHYLKDAHFTTTVHKLFYLLTADGKLYKKMSEMMAFQSNDDIGWIFLYAASRQRTDLMDRLFNNKKNIEIEYIAAIAIDHTEFFYGAFQDRYIELLPDNFIDKTGKIKPLNEFVSELFNEVTWYFHSKMAFKDYLTNISILKRLNDTISVDSLRRISNYIPDITVIYDINFSCVSEGGEFSKFIAEKTGSTIFLEPYFFNGVGNLISWAGELTEIYSKHTIYFYADDMLKNENKKRIRCLLKTIYEKNLYPAYRNTVTESTLNSIAEMNSTTITSYAIKLGIINRRNYEEMLDMVIDKKAFKVMNVMNKEYNEILSKSRKRISIKRESGTKKNYFYIYV